MNEELRALLRTEGRAQTFCWAEPVQSFRIGRPARLRWAALTGISGQAGHAGFSVSRSTQLHMLAGTKMEMRLRHPRQRQSADVQMMRGFREQPLEVDTACKKELSRRWVPSPCVSILTLTHTHFHIYVYTNYLTCLCSGFSCPSTTCFWHLAVLPTKNHHGLTNSIFVIRLYYPLKPSAL